MKNHFKLEAWVMVLLPVLVLAVAIAAALIVPHVKALNRNVSAYPTAEHSPEVQKIEMPSPKLAFNSAFINYQSSQRQSTMPSVG